MKLPQLHSWELLPRSLGADRVGATPFYTSTQSGQTSRLARAVEVRPASRPG